MLFILLYFINKIMLGKLAKAQKVRTGDEDLPDPCKVE